MPYRVPIGICSMCDYEKKLPHNHPTDKKKGRVCTTCRQSTANVGPCAICELKLPRPSKHPLDKDKRICKTCYAGKRWKYPFGLCSGNCNERRSLKHEHPLDKSKGKVCGKCNFHLTRTKAAEDKKEEKAKKAKGKTAVISPKVCKCALCPTVALHSKALLMLLEEDSRSLVCDECFETKKCAACGDRVKEKHSTHKRGEHDLAVYDCHNFCYFCDLSQTVMKMTGIFDTRR